MSYCLDNDIPLMGFCRGAQMLGQKDELDVDFGVGEQRLDERRILFQIECIDAIGASRLQMGRHLVHVAGICEFPVFVFEVERDICIAPRIVAHRIGNIAAFPFSHIAHIHDGARVFFLHRSCGIDQNGDEIWGAVGDAALVLHGQLPQQQTGGGQWLAVDHIAVARVTDRKRHIFFFGQPIEHSLWFWRVFPHHFGCLAYQILPAQLTRKIIRSTL